MPSGVRVRLPPWSPLNNRQTMITYTALAIILGAFWLLGHIIFAGIAIEDRMPGRDWILAVLWSFMAVVFLGSEWAVR